MVLVDVNVLVYAHQKGAARHQEFRGWLEDTVNGEGAYAMSELVLSGFIRVVTNPRVFARPTPLPEALEFAELLRSKANCVRVSPGPRHWGIFSRLCIDVGARGNLVPDAYLAALAIESSSEWITTDRDFSRFPGLQWRHPLAPAR